MGKIIIFYKYVSIVHPQKVRDWLKQLCTDCGLKGRILIGREGINGTLGGTEESLARYAEKFLEHELFADIDIKESVGDDYHFPRLRIVIRDEIVKLGIRTQTLFAHGKGIALDPAAVHQLLANKPDNLAILDTRNLYESSIGAFVGAIKPPINFFRDLPAFIDKNENLFKDKEVLLYCTAGIRCESASAYLKSKNIAKEVYQIKGGIHRYVEKYPDGFFRGKNYVFDGRISVKVNEDIVGRCVVCAKPYDEPTNCINANCNKQFIACAECIISCSNTCDHTCLSLVKNKQVRIRTVPAKLACTVEDF